MRIEIGLMIDPDAALAKILRQRRHERCAAAMADEVDRKLRQSHAVAVAGDHPVSYDVRNLVRGKCAVADALPIKLHDDLSRIGVARSVPACFALIREYGELI